MSFPWQSGIAVPKNELLCMTNAPESSVNVGHNLSGVWGVCYFSFSFLFSSYNLFSVGGSFWVPTLTTGRSGYMKYFCLLWVFTSGTCRWRISHKHQSLIAFLSKSFSCLGCELDDDMMEGDSLKGVSAATSPIPLHQRWKQKVLVSLVLPNL